MMTMVTIVLQKTDSMGTAGFFPMREAREIWYEDQKGGKEPQKRDGSW